MALIEIKTDPSARDLKWFGAILFAFFGVVGLLLRKATGDFTASTYVWSAAAALVLTYYGIAAVQRPMFVGWMYLCYPLGWVVSHVLLAAIYFGVMTPIGVIMRAFGHDALKRRFDRGAATYWIEHEPVSDVKRYFRQF